MSPWAQKWRWTQVLQIIILHFSPAMLPGCTLGFTTLQNHPQCASISLHRPHSLRLPCFCTSRYPTWDAPIPLVYLMVIKIQLKCGLLCDTIPELLKKKTDHAFTVCPILLLPHIYYPLYSVYIVNCIYFLFIYRSISLTKLWTCWRQRPSCIFVSQAQCLVEILWMNI